MKFKLPFFKAKPLSHYPSSILNSFLSIKTALFDIDKNYLKENTVGVYLNMPKNV